MKTGMNLNLPLPHPRYVQSQFLFSIFAKFIILTKGVSIRQMFFFFIKTGMTLTIILPLPRDVQCTLYNPSSYTLLTVYKSVLLNKGVFVGQMLDSMILRWNDCQLQEALNNIIIGGGFFPK